MLWTFKAASPSELFQKLRQYVNAATIGQISAEMLVVNSSADQVAGSNAQAKQFYNALTTRKSYLEFDASQGAQFHCQLGAPQVSGERILDWLDERAKPQPGGGREDGGERREVPPAPGGMIPPDPCDGGPIG